MLVIRSTKHWPFERGLADGSMTAMSDGSAQLEDQLQEMGMFSVVADQMLTQQTMAWLRLFAYWALLGNH